MTPPAPTITSINDKGARCQKSEETKMYIWNFIDLFSQFFGYVQNTSKHWVIWNLRFPPCPFLDMIFPFKPFISPSWPSSSSIAHVLVPVHNNQNWPNTQNIRTFPIKVYLETAGKAVNYWSSIWPPPREGAGSPVGILRTHICSGAPGRWSSISDIDGMAPKTSVLPFPACAFFPRGSTSAHLVDMNPDGPARSSRQLL